MVSKDDAMQDLKDILETFEAHNSRTTQAFALHAHAMGAITKVLMSVMDPKNEEHEDAWQAYMVVLKHSMSSLAHGLGMTEDEINAALQFANLLTNRVERHEGALFK